MDQFIEERYFDKEHEMELRKRYNIDDIDDDVPVVEINNKRQILFFVFALVFAIAAGIFTGWALATIEASTVR